MEHQHEYKQPSSSQNDLPFFIYLFNIFRLSFVFLLTESHAIRFDLVVVMFCFPQFGTCMFMSYFDDGSFSSLALFICLYCVKHGVLPGFSLSLFHFPNSYMRIFYSFSNCCREHAFVNDIVVTARK